MKEELIESQKEIRNSFIIVWCFMYMCYLKKSKQLEFPILCWKCVKSLDPLQLFEPSFVLAQSLDFEKGWGVLITNCDDQNIWRIRDISKLFRNEYSSIISVYGNVEWECQDLIVFDFRSWSYGDEENGMVFYLQIKWACRGRPNTATITEIIEQVHNIVSGHLSLTSGEIADTIDLVSRRENHYALR